MKFTWRRIITISRELGKRIRDMPSYDYYDKESYHFAYIMVFTSVYGAVDGFFVSDFAGKAAFTAVNFIMLFLMILGAVGFMFGAGGRALNRKGLGREKDMRQMK